MEVVFAPHVAAHNYKVGYDVWKAHTKTAGFLTPFEYVECVFHARMGGGHPSETEFTDYIEVVKQLIPDNEYGEGFFEKNSKPDFDSFFGRHKSLDGHTHLEAWENELVSLFFFLSCAAKFHSPPPASGL